MQHGADLDAGVLADIDGAVDEEGDVGADDLGDVHLQRLAIGAGGAAHPDGALGLLLVGPVEVPQAHRKGGGVLRRQGQEILDERVGGILLQEGSERGIVGLCLWGVGANCGKQIVAGEGEVVRQGKISGMDAACVYRGMKAGGIRPSEC